MWPVRIPYHPNRMMHPILTGRKHFAENIVGRTTRPTPVLILMHTSYTLAELFTQTQGGETGLFEGPFGTWHLSTAHTHFLAAIFSPSW